MDGADQLTSRLVVDAASTEGVAGGPGASPSTSVTVTFTVTGSESSAPSLAITWKLRRAAASWLRFALTDTWPLEWPLELIRKKSASLPPSRLQVIGSPSASVALNDDPRFELTAVFSGTSISTGSGPPITGALFELVVPVTLSDQPPLPSSLVALTRTS